MFLTKEQRVFVACSPRFVPQALVDVKMTAAAPEANLDARELFRCMISACGGGGSICESGIQL